MIHFILSVLASRSRIGHDEFEAEFDNPLLRCFGKELQELISLGVVERVEEGFVVGSNPGAEFHLARVFYEKEVVQRLMDAASRVPGRTAGNSARGVRPEALRDG